MKKLIGYVGVKDISDVREADIRALDVINLAFGTVEGNRIAWNHEQYREDLRRVRSINPQIQILLSVGGWGCGGFSDMALTREGREEFIESAVKVAGYENIDGIDLDWEYPCIGTAGIDAAKADKENFTSLLGGLREALDGMDAYKMLTIAAGGGAYYLECTEMEKIVPYLDYVQIMTYDLRGGFTIQTGHHTNLYSVPEDFSSASVDYCVKIFEEAGVPREKIVIGAAFYSREWKAVPDRCNGYQQMAGTTGGYGPGYSELVESYINKNGFVRYWDDEAQAPYLFNGEHFISYDDEESIRAKIDYLKDRDLAGIMYWEYGCDKSYTLTGKMARWIRE